MTPLTTMLQDTDRRLPSTCLACVQQFENAFTPRCPRCQGPTDVFYDLSRVRIGDRDEDVLMRYADLLPVRDRDLLARTEMRPTPLVHARELGATVGLRRLYLKVEGANPTGSTKDRMAAVALPFLLERGVHEFTVSSTGNSSTSFGALAPRFPEATLHIFCGAAFLDRLGFGAVPNVSVYTVDGSFVAAGKAATEFARRRGLAFENGFFNPARREGLKLTYLEATDEMPLPPSVVVQAISSGMGLYGAHKGFREYLGLGRIPRMPRIVAAQQASCAPMFKGWEAGVTRLDASYVVRDPQGLAKAILRGDAAPTFPVMQRVVRSTGGRFVAASDDEIHTARALLAELEGIDACYASAVALACTLQLARSGGIDPDEPVLVNLTGRDRPPTAPPPARRWEDLAG